MTWFITFIATFFSNLFKGYAVYLKGKVDGKQEVKIEQLEADLEAAERLQNVQTTSDRDVALAKLRERGKVRD